MAIRSLESHVIARSQAAPSGKRILFDEDLLCVFCRGWNFGLEEKQAECGRGEKGDPHVIDDTAENDRFFFVLDG